jgi:S-adenosyl methyltransferase
MAVTATRERGLIEPRIDTEKPHTARIYDYYLGGKDNFAADRRTAERAMQSWPAVRTAVRENRAFLGRAVRYLVAEAGIRQFLDIGTGLPSANNVHEVAQGLVPSCRVVYVDNDPIVLAHARALLTSAPEGKTAYIHADLREPEKILSDPVTRQALDFSQPIALMLVAVLHFVPDADGPRRIVDTLLGALPSGSYLAASHVTPEHDPVGVGGLERTYQASGLPAQARVADDFADLAFRGLDMVDPGLVLVSEWRPAAGSVRPQASEVNWYGAIARKR